jgi:alkylhydroperoxidase family enzyme
MAWIETPREDAWDGELGDLYEQVIDREHDRVDNIMQIHALNPRAMAAHQGLYVSAMAGTKNLRRVDREMIALVVSSLNECHY